MAYLTQIDTSTLTNQNINAALLVHTFTNATRARKVFFNVFLTDVVGGGDYIAYLTWQRGGAGVFYETIRTTKSVGAGVISNAFNSIPLSVGVGDVVRVYVIGLAGDNVNAVDIITDVWEEFVATDASGFIYLAPAQGPVTFTGQVKVTANVAGEGALHVENLHATGFGQYNSGLDGQENIGSRHGQSNFGGANHGQYNWGTESGIYAYGLTQFGLELAGGTAGLVAVGPIGGWFMGTGTHGIRAQGPTAATSPDWQGPTGQTVRDAMKLAPSAGAPAAGSVDTHLDDILADTTEIGAAGAGLTAIPKTGYKLASDGLDQISAAEPTGRPTTFAGWIMWLIQKARRSNLTSTELTTMTEAGATITTQAVSDDGTVQSLGAPS